MKKVILFLLFLVHLCGSTINVTHGQDGHLFLTHYSPQNTNGIDPKVFNIVQGSNGLMYFAHNKGVLRFDGGRWNIIQTPGSIYSLNQGPEKKIFVGGKDFFGYLKTFGGNEEFTLLSKGIQNIGKIRQILSTDREVFFLGENVLYSYHIASKEVKRVFNGSEDLELISFFKNQNKIYLEIAEKGFFSLEGTVLKSIRKWLPKQDEVMAAHEIDSTRTYLYTLDNQLYLFQNEVIKSIPIKESEFLARSEVVDFVVVNENQVAFSTLRAGCIIINLQNGAIENWINYQTGLADNEIVAIGKDRSGGVWLSHPFGISRADTEMPIRDFTSYQGLNGTPLSVERAGGSLYVGTTTGLFQLEEIKSYEETAYLVKEKIDVKSALQGNQNVIRTVELSSDSTQKKSGTTTLKLQTAIVYKSVDINEVNLDPRTEKELKRIKRKEEKKKKKESIDSSTNDTSEAEERETSEDTNTQNKVNDAQKEEDNKGKELLIDTKSLEKDSVQTIEKSVSSKTSNNSKSNQNSQSNTYIDRLSDNDIKRIITLKSVSHTFRKVEGIDGKCEHIRSFGNLLLAGTYTGLYTVKENKAQKILPERVEALIPDEKRSIVIVNTDNSKLQVWQNSHDAWIKKSEFNSFTDRIHALSMDNKRNIWVCGVDDMYKLSLNENLEINSAKAYRLNNPYNDEVTPLILEGKVHFILSSQTYTYDSEKDLLEMDSIFNLQINKRSHLISTSYQSIWTLQESHWQVLGGFDTHRRSLILLNTIPNIKNIFHQDGKDEVIWILTARNRLLRFIPSSSNEIHHEYGLILVGLKDEENQGLSDIKLQVPYDYNSITFEYTSPSYLKEKGARYQYLLKGAMEEWSEWSTDGNLKFHGLEPGTYTLIVRSQNVFGHIEESAPLKFKVTLPYWRKPFFYAIEMAFFGFLVVITTLLNRNDKNSNNKWIGFIRKTLTILTLILCMEFLKVILESYINITGSPVIDFGMEVLLALLIFPFEKLLSLFILRGEQVKIRRDKIKNESNTL